MKRILVYLFAVFFATGAYAPPSPVKHLFTIIFENTNTSDVLKQPFFSTMMKQGALLNDYHALAHPSQPNYIGLIAGDEMGVNDDGNFNVKGKQLGDLLEAKGLRWKAYVEGWPGNCSLKATKGRYARKHNPFISFVTLQQDKQRCNEHIVDASQLDKDIASGNLPEYAFYVPDLDNDGHDTGIEYADNWLAHAFGPRFKDPRFMNGTVVALTFDENDALSDHDHNRIYTVMLGATVKSGAISNKYYTHYSLLSTIEKMFGLGNLGRQDATAPVIDDIWN